MIKKKKTGAHSTVTDRSKNRRRRELSPDDDAFLGGSAGQEESAEETPAPAPGKRARHIIDHENDATENLPTGGITPAEMVQETAEESRERRRKAGKAKSGRSSTGIAALIIVMVAAVLAGLIGFLGYKITVSEKNLPNVYVDDVFVGGLTREQTLAALDEHKWDEATEESLKVQLLGDVSFEVGMCESGLLLTKENAVEAAYRYGHSGNWFQNFFTYAAGLFGHVDVNEHGKSINSDYIRGLIDAALKKQNEETADNGYTVDEKKGVLTMLKGAGQIKMDPDAIYSAVLTALESGQKSITYTTLVSQPKMPDFQAIHDELAIEPVDAYFDPETKTIVDNVDGFRFDVKAAENEWNGADYGETISIPVTITVPEVTTESLEALLFRDILGEQETLYYTYDSNRVNNLHLAVSKIDGLILNPGEEFSYNDIVGQRTEEAGFKSAGAYDDGQVVQEIGGGVCQISSTLYSACLYAQMEILERSNHYFKVDYLDYSMDATVSWPSPNFRFRNNREYPIKIHAFCNDEYDTYSHQGGVRIEILGTDLDGSYVKIWRETWMIGHPEFPDICIGYSILQHRDIYSADGTLIRSETYDYLDEYYLHEEAYADKVEARRQAQGGGGGPSGDADMNFG